MSPLVRSPYKTCVVSIFQLDTVLDLVELNMVNFDVILGWIDSTLVILPCTVELKGHLLFS